MLIMILFFSTLYFKNLNDRYNCLALRYHGNTLSTFGKTLICDSYDLSIIMLILADDLCITKLCDLIMWSGHMTDAVKGSLYFSELF